MLISSVRTVTGLVVSCDRLIHLLATDCVVSAFSLPAYILLGQFFVIVPFDPDPNHTRFVHNLLDDFAIFANDFACCERNIWFQVLKRCHYLATIKCIENMKEMHVISNSPTRFLGTGKESSLNSKNVLACLTASGVWFRRNKHSEKNNCRH